MEKPSVFQDLRAALIFPNIVASCRIRLARNLRGEVFPQLLDEQNGRRLRDSLCGHLGKLPDFEDGQCLLVESVSSQYLLDLNERHLISLELTESGARGAVLLDAEHSKVVMVNEEDHLRIQILRDDANLSEAWRIASDLDDRIEAGFDIAFDDKLGYLTACPSNLGTGLRASVMLHLLGLGLTDEIEQVFKGLERLGFVVRGFGGEGTEAAGHLYQISNQQTMGESEEDILARLAVVVAETARQEQNARLRLMEDDPEVLLDCFARALAILGHARILRSDEALDCLAALRMGVEMRFVRGVEVSVIENWMSMVQPGHLQTMANGVFDAEQRDRMRAGLMREWVVGVRLAEVPAEDAPG